MARRLIDLRSDTVTKPTAAMREAMVTATVGDDVFGEDETVLELEATVAKLLGKEAALFVPSGTMANQIAIALQTRPGETILTEEGAHCAIFEAGGAAVLSGVQCDLLPRAVRWRESEMVAAIKPQGVQTAPTSMMIIENTHNVGGGRVLYPKEMEAACAVGARLGLALHMDGARLWNAAVALGESEATLAGPFTTLAVCFSKGLGAPVGSAFVGPKAMMAPARRLRKRWGGGMRQAGIIAAGALHAVAHHRPRLAQDHQRAAALAQGLRGLEVAGVPVAVEFAEPGTNMVYCRFGWGTPPAHVAAFAEQGVLLTEMVGGWLRLVTHLDLSDADIEQTLAVFQQFGRSAAKRV